MDSKDDTKYFEISSSYRNRNQDPLSTNFAVTTGNLPVSPAEFVDPVCDKAPLLSWRSNELVLQSLSDYITLKTVPFITTVTTLGGTNTQTSFIATADNAAGHDLQNIEGYYVGMVLQWRNAATLNERRRIIGYKPLGVNPDTAANDVVSALFTVESSFSADFVSTVSTLLLEDPTYFPTDNISASIFVPTGSDVDDAYQNYYILNETIAVAGGANYLIKVASYDALTHLATLDPTYSSLNWATNDYYSLVLADPGPTFQAGAGSTTSTVDLAAGSLTQVGAYVGYWIRCVQQGSNSDNECRRIIAYDGTTATVTPAFTVTMSNLYYQIFVPDRDNYTPIRAPMSVAKGNPVRKYAVQLLALNIPNQVLSVGNGGVLNRYPYVILEISNMASGTSNTNSIYSNNPNVTQARFICAVDDIRNLSQTSFLNIDADGMVAVGMFNLLAGFRLTLKLPNGDIVRFKDFPYTETLNPFNPVPELQMSMVLAFRQI